ncbi:MAG: hypothetical protein WBQ53_06430, partial [Methylocystis sp.]
KLGEAPVADPAANVLTVTGPAPTPVGQGSAELAKNYNPEQPRDWHGRFGSGRGEAKAKSKNSGAQVAQAQLAPAIAREIVTDAPKVLPYLAPAIGAGARAINDWWNSDSKKPDDAEPAKDKTPPAAPSQPAASAATPEPEEPKTDERAPQTTAQRGELKGSTDGLTDAEKRFVERQLAAGNDVETIPAESRQRSADFYINGVRTELKTVSGVADTSSDGLSSAISNRIMNARGQSDVIHIDALDQPGMTKEIAERAIRRAYSADKAGRISRITIEAWDGTVVRPRR